MKTSRKHIDQLKIAEATNKINLVLLSIIIKNKLYSINALTMMAKKTQNSKLLLNLIRQKLHKIKFSTFQSLKFQYKNKI